MQKLRERVTDKRGQTLVETAGGIIIISIIFSIALEVAPIFNGIYTIDRVANEVARYVEVCGDAGRAGNEFDRLTDEKKLQNVTMAITPSGKIQMDEEFTITITYTPGIKIGAIVNVPLTLRRKATGRSEVYWK